LLGALASGAWARPWVLGAAVAVAAGVVLVEPRQRGAPPAAPEPRWLRLAAPGAVIAAALAVGLPTLSCDFVSDDFGYGGLASRLPFSGIFALRDVSQGLLGDRPDQLRPLYALYLKLGVLAFGVDGRGFHLVQVLLHAANALLVFCIARAVSGGHTAVA